MKKLNLIVLWIILFTGCSLRKDALSQNQSLDSNNDKKIEEVFGIKFGEKLSNLNVIEKYPDNFYIVNAPKPSESYILYSIFTTPQNKEVYMIMGTNSFKSKEVCEINKVNTRNLLINKYGNNSLIKENSDFFLFSINGVMITLMCDKDNALGVAYTNMSLYEKAEFEKNINKN